MSESELAGRWVDENGELRAHPSTGPLPSDEDIRVGLAMLEHTFRPPSVDRISVVLEGWEEEIRVRWDWTVSPHALVGGYAYRYAYEDEWKKWSVSRLPLGYSPDRIEARKKEGHGGVSFKVGEYGIGFKPR